MAHLISVIVPNHNGAATIEHCLEAVHGSKYDHFEVIVVDDCSDDDSVSIIKKFPCQLIKLTEHAGASKARNIGALHSRGEILFFTDADCVLNRDALATATLSLASHGHDTIIGGTYTAKPFDPGFFNSFQSIFIHYSETKNHDRPDYIATHALIMNRSLFDKNGGFAEEFMPILEDVEFSHRLLKKGLRLYIDPHVLVRHIFNFSLISSITNGFRKAKYWTAYSIRNKDLLADSGTASVELKSNVISFLIFLTLIITGFFLRQPALFIASAVILSLNIFINRNLFRAFYKTEGLLFLFSACLYYMFIYAAVVATGALAGVILSHTHKRI